MENIQINGQKIWGPPTDWTGPPPPHGTEIYIKNLPDDVCEIELCRIFSTVGRVYEVRLPVHWSGANRGYAFLRFTRIAEADAAIGAFDGFEIRSGRTVKIERSVDNTRLFLSSVPNQKTSEDIKTDLQTVVDNVERVYVYPTLENPSLFRGYAFVEFKSHRDAAIAKRILTPDVCFNLFEKKCIAAWANPLPFLNENILKTINILFVRNVPKDMKNITIKKAIENLLKDNSLQKVKRLNDFAFLTFRTHESAKTALDLIKNCPGLLGSSKIQVEWAVPRDLNLANGNGTMDDTDGKRHKSGGTRSQRDRPAVPSLDFKSTNLLKTLDDSDYNMSCMTDLQQDFKVTNTGKKFRKIIKNSQMQFVQGGDGTGTEPASFGSVQKTWFGLNTPGYSFLDYMQPPSPSPLETGPCHVTRFSSSDNSENTWNLSPMSDAELDDPFPLPQGKPKFGTFMYSSCSSPALTISSGESPIHWNGDESVSPAMVAPPPGNNTTNMRVTGTCKLFSDFDSSHPSSVGFGLTKLTSDQSSLDGTLFSQQF